MTWETFEYVASWVAVIGFTVCVIAAALLNIGWRAWAIECERQEAKKAFDDAHVHAADVGLSLTQAIKEFDAKEGKIQALQRELEDLRSKRLDLAHEAKDAASQCGESREAYDKALALNLFSRLEKR